MSLWAIWKGRELIGYGLGDANAATLQRAMGNGFVFSRSKYPEPRSPAVWASGWVPVWKDHYQFGRTEWGAFVEGWNVWVTQRLQRLFGFTAARTTSRFTPVT